MGKFQERVEKADNPDENPDDVLKKHYIYFVPRLNRDSKVICTCGEFQRSGTNIDWLSRKAVQHARKTGHDLNPRGI